MPGKGDRFVIQITQPAEESLFQRGVRVVPDFVANGGGVVVVLTDWLGGSAQDVFSSLTTLLPPLTQQILLDAEQQGVNPRQLAISQATQKVLRARQANQSLTFDQFKADIERRFKPGV